MPFSFLDIEVRQTRRIFLLFLTLVFFYFTGAFLIYTVSLLDFFYELFFAGPGRQSAAGNFSLLPSAGSILCLSGGAFLAAVIHWGFSVRNMVSRIVKVVGAQPLDPQDRYHLLARNIVDEVSVATGGMKIETVVVPTRSLNAFALSDLGGRAVIGVTEGLLLRLNRRQLESVIAHEAAHIVWGDCLSTTVSCSMAAVYAGLMKAMTSGLQDEGSGIHSRRAGLPVSVAIMTVVVIMRFLTLLLNTWLSRERETRADATAVRLTRDPLGLAEALYRISMDRRGGGMPVNELSPIFIISPSEKKLEESQGLLPDLFTTHPPVSKRLQMLLDMGHADYRILESGMTEKPGYSEEVQVTFSEQEKIWFALHENTWEGPFSLIELARLLWLKPFTWVTREDDCRVKPAHEFRQLNAVLKKGLANELYVQTCPSCGNRLKRVYYEGIPIWRCDGCGGRLVKAQQMSRIIIRDDITYSDEIREEARRIKDATMQKRGKYFAASPSKLSCPACGNSMERSFYRALLPHRVEIDVCRVCDVFWLDRYEIEIIQYLIGERSEEGFFMLEKGDGAKRL